MGTGIDAGSRDTLALALDQLPVALFVARLADGQGAGQTANDVELVYANAMLLELAQTGPLSAGQRLGSVLEALGTAEPEFVDLCLRVASAGAPGTIEQYHARSGRWFSVRAFSAQAQHVTVLLEDIGARKAVEAKARLHEAIVSSAEFAVVSTDLEGRITSWNNKAQAMYGFSEAEVLGHRLTQNMSDAEKAQEADVLARVRKGESIPVFEVRRKRRDGGTLDVSVSASPVLDEAGRIVGVARMARDITAQKRDAEAAAQSEHRMRTIIDASPVPLALNDAQARVTFLNAAFTRTFGYTVEDVPDLQSWWDLAYPDPQYRRWVIDTWGERVQESMRSGGAFRALDVVVRCKDGTDRTVVAGAVDLKGALNDTHLVTLFDITDLVNVHRSLARAERYAEQVLQSVGEGLCQIGADARVTYINPAGARLLGYTSQELVGQSASILLARASATGAADPLKDAGVEQLAGTGLRVESDTENFRRKDGSVFAVHYVSAPMVVDDTAQGVVVTFRDITVEQQMRKRLLDDEVKIRKAQEIAGFGSYATDLTTGLWESSAQLDWIFGIDETFVHDIPHWNELLAPEYRQMALDHYLEVAAGKCDFRLDYEIIRPRDGVRRWVAANGEIERNAQGEPLRLIGTIQDITNRKEAELALQRSHNLLKKLSEQVPGVLFRVEMDSSGRLSVPYVSEGLQAIAGISASQLRSDLTLALQLVSLEERTSLINSLMAATRAGRDWSHLFAVRMPDGQLRWRTGRARAEELPDGGWAWHGTISDATERVEAQRQLQLLNESLESRVRQRTSELAEALNQAETAKRSRGEFLAKMSHEIRTPLNAILGLSYLANRGDSLEKMREHLGQIRNSGKHLLGIVNDVLDFSKIDAGKLVLEAGEFDLDLVIRHVMDLSRVRAAGKPIELSQHVDPALPRHWRGDSLRLCQVLINFLNNAIKFTDEGSVSLHVLGTTGAVTQPSGALELRFEVRDTGIGMSEEQQKRMFMSFEQGDNSITRKFGGTGLGLAISKQLVELMGGMVGTSSEPGKGSTFWCSVRLEPVQATSVAAANPAFAQPDMAAAARDILRGRHILVVDDNDFNLEVARGLLEEVGALATMASNGAQAVLLMDSEPFDAVLMDVQMPVMDGMEATRQIRSSDRYGDAVVIAMTANALREDRDRYLAVGMDDVITKPIDPEVFFQTVARYVAQGKSVATVSSADPAPSASVPPPQASTPTVSAAPASDASTAALALEAWDAGALARAVGNDAAVHNRLLGRYLSGSAQQSEALREALLAGDWKQAGEVAHKLKSSSRTVGAMQLGQWCEAMEKAGRAADGPQCLALQAPLMQSLELARGQAEAAAAAAERRMEGTV